eukprot:gene3221-13240_t
MFAGHDTTARALTNTLYYLSINPEMVCTEAVMKETLRMMPIIGSQPQSGMFYTEAVIRETLRMMPIVGSQLRAAKCDFEFNGHRVPEGTQVMNGIGYMTAHDPRWEGKEGELDPSNYYPARHLMGGKNFGPKWEGKEGDLDPSRFYPARHLMGDEKLGTQVGFGLGRRSCPGQSLAFSETKVFLATLARGYKYKADWKTDFSRFPMPGPKNGLPVFVERL